MTAENGQPITPTTPLSDAATAKVPPGTAEITWQSVDSLGFTDQVSQVFQIESPGPCLGDATPGNGWHAIAGGPVTPGTQPGGGSGPALEVTTTTNWNALVSPTFSTTGLIVGANLEFDLYLPPNLAGQGWWGGVQALISIPSANLFHQFLGGNFDLKGAQLPLGQFSTIKIPLPTAVVNALAAPHDDVTIEIDLNSPAGSPPGPVGPWFIENLRFGS